MKFENTPEGYKAAMKYLHKTGSTHLLNYEKSVDVFTVVALANKIFKDYSRQDKDK